jgi:N utilization substance protein A
MAVRRRKRNKKQLAAQLLEAVKVIENEKGIERESIFKALEEGLARAYEKSCNNMIDVVTEIDRNTGKIYYYQVKTITDEVYDENTEIALDEVRRFDEDAEIDDEVKLLLPEKDLSRVAAQITKQIFTQKIKDEENDLLYEKYKDKKGELMTGIIQRKAGSTYYLSVDNSKIEVALYRREQIRNERYELGKKIRFYAVDVIKEVQGMPRIIASRSREEFVVKLFEFEISEVFDKVIEIKGISRSPGFRCKIGVVSHDSNVDPVGTCVGSRGSRIQAIVRELNGEKIDVIPYNPAPEIYIKNALKPAKVESVTVNMKEKAAIVVVPKEYFSLAIGKRGVNVRLAARLTGYDIDIKEEDLMSNEQALKEAEALFQTDETVEIAETDEHVKEEKELTKDDLFQGLKNKEEKNQKEETE